MPYAPPPELAPHIHAAVAAVVTFFGQRLEIRCVPYAQQDELLGRCAHVAAWICHASAALRGDAQRRPMADFSIYALPELSDGRSFPSPGLTRTQLTAVLGRFGLPSVVHQVGELPETGREERVVRQTANVAPGRWDTRIVPVCSRLLNSGYPVIVAVDGHAFTLIGYCSTPRPKARPWVTFIRHDDLLGPYLPVENVLADVDRATGSGFQYGPWRALVAPLPPDLWRTAESVERAAPEFLKAIDPLRGSFRFDELDAKGHITLRTRAVTARELQANANARGLPTLCVERYRMARLPKRVWVVEAVDRRLRNAGRPSVVGEVVFDPTTAREDQDPLLVRSGGRIATFDASSNEWIIDDIRSRPCRQVV